MIAKTIAGFANADGGTLLIGVNDSGLPVGIESDLGTLTRKDHDGYEQFLTNLVAKSIGVERCPDLAISFHKVEDANICMVRVNPSPKPAYVTDGAERRLYVRTGNSTRPLTTQPRPCLRRRALALTPVCPNPAYRSRPWSRMRSSRVCAAPSGLRMRTFVMERSGDGTPLSGGTHGCACRLPPGGFGKVTTRGRPAKISLIWKEVRVRGLDLCRPAHPFRGKKVATPHRQFFTASGEPQPEAVDLDAEGIEKPQ